MDRQGLTAQHEEDIDLDGLRADVEHWNREEQILLTAQVPNRNRLAWVRWAREEAQTIIVVLEAYTRAAHRKSAAERNETRAAILSRTFRPRSRSFSNLTRISALDDTPLLRLQADTEVAKLACSLRDAKRRLALETDLSVITKEALLISRLSARLQAKEKALTSPVQPAYASSRSTGRRANHAFHSDGVQLRHRRYSSPQQSSRASTAATHQSARRPSAPAPLTLLSKVKRAISDDFDATTCADDDLTGFLLEEITLYRTRLGSYTASTHISTVRVDLLSLTKKKTPLAERRRIIQEERNAGS